MDFVIVIPGDGDIAGIKVQPGAPPGSFDGEVIRMTIQSARVRADFNSLKVFPEFWGFLSAAVAYFWVGEKGPFFRSEDVTFFLTHKLELKPFLSVIKLRISKLKEVSHEKAS